MPYAYRAITLSVKAFQAPAVLGDQLGLEIAGPIPGELDLELAVFDEQPLPGAAIARVAAIGPRGRVLLVAQVLGHLALEGVLHDALGQVLDQAVLTQKLLGALAPDQLIE